MKLCYIEGQWAYFTSQELSKQWGDDWNDAPYEHNAGDPYEWREGDEREPWEIMKVAFHGPFGRPCDTGGWWSVQTINEGRTPWLSFCRYSTLPEGYEGPTCLMAGASPQEFTRFVEGLGGKVYVSLSDVRRLRLSE